LVQSLAISSLFTRPARGESSGICIWTVKFSSEPFSLFSSSDVFEYPNLARSSGDKKLANEHLYSDFSSLLSGFFFLKD